MCNKLLLIPPLSWFKSAENGKGERESKSQEITSFTVKVVALQHEEGSYSAEGTEIQELSPHFCSWAFFLFFSHFFKAHSCVAFVAFYTETQIHAGGRQRRPRAICLSCLVPVFPPLLIFSFLAANFGMKRRDFFLLSLFPGHAMRGREGKREKYVALF